MLELMMSPSRENKPIFVSGGELEEQAAEEDADHEKHPAFRGACRKPPTETASIRAGFRSVVAIVHFRFVLLECEQRPVALSPSLTSRSVPTQN